MSAETTLFNNACTAQLQKKIYLELHTEDDKEEIVVLNLKIHIIAKTNAYVLTII